MRGHDIVVMGTSAGGVDVLKQVLKGLPPDFPASVFIVMHLAPHVPSFLPQVLLRSSRLPVEAVREETRFHPGRIYVAPPDRHLILSRTTVTSTGGPRENWHRPSIDVLFRSAARSFGPRVVGVVLTGFLDDGSAGLAAIRARGGIAVVQDPDDALFPDMPLNALRTVKVDHCVPAAQIPDVLIASVKQAPGHGREAGISEEVAIETEIAKTSMNGRNALEKIGTPSTFTCPECQGPLWELKDGQLLRFRCQVGHAFSAESMLSAQQDVVERSLWIALGAIQSRLALWRRIADRMKESRLGRMSAFYQEKAREASRDMEDLRRLLTRSAGPGRGSRGRPEGSPPRAAAASVASAARRRPARRSRTPGRSRRTSARAR